MHNPNVSRQQPLDYGDLSRNRWLIPDPLLKDLALILKQDEGLGGFRHTLGGEKQKVLVIHF